MRRGGDRRASAVAACRRASPRRRSRARCRLRAGLRRACRPRPSRRAHPGTRAAFGFLVDEGDIVGLHAVKPTTEMSATRRLAIPSLAKSSTWLRPSPFRLRRTSRQDADFCFLSRKGRAIAYDCRPPHRHGFAVTPLPRSTGERSAGRATGAPPRPHAVEERCRALGSCLRQAQGQAPRGGEGEIPICDCPALKGERRCGGAPGLMIAGMAAPAPHSLASFADLWSWERRQAAPRRQDPGKHQS